MSGLPTARIAFDGFLPRSGSERRERLTEVSRERRTTVLYEAPHRLERTLVDLAEACGPDRQVVLAREMTKLHEDFWRGTLADAVIHAQTVAPRGEYALVIGPAISHTTDITDADIAALEEALQPFAPPKKQTAPPRAIIGKSSADLSEAERRRQAAYGNAILDRELPQIAAMPPESGRNNRVFALACRVGRYVHHGILPVQEIETGILEACKANGLTKDPGGQRGVLMTIRNGIAAAAADGLPDLGPASAGRGER